MDGLLVIDKPAGPTSHDVVARMRRVLGEPRIGHTGTLDPAATGVLPLVIGRATRLARFMPGDKSYEAVICLGRSTDTGDADGREVRPEVGPRSDLGVLSIDTVDAALAPFRGTFLQQPPVFSAKKLSGRRSYRLARADRRAQNSHEVGPGSDLGPTQVRPPVERPAPVTVATHAIDILSLDRDRLTLRIDCSAGFYVRSLAHDLGERLGIGAHLAALRRTRSGEFSFADAVPLDAAERDPADAARRVIPLARLLTTLAGVVLTAEGVRRAAHGRDLGPADSLRGFAAGSLTRLLDSSGDLVGIAEPAVTPGLLHPSVVLM